MTKFSLDPSPNPQVVIPGTGCKRKYRNEASWLECWMSDTELDGVMEGATPSPGWGVIAKRRLLRDG
jgi:hypothetical protein